jgi:hypothetical protein
MTTRLPLLTEPDCPTAVTVVVRSTLSAGPAKASIVFARLDTEQDVYPITFHFNFLKTPLFTNVKQRRVGWNIDFLNRTLKNRDSMRFGSLGS